MEAVQRWGRECLMQDKHVAFFPTLQNTHGSCLWTLQHTNLKQNDSLSPLFQEPDFQLFDLNEDPNETTNVIEDYPEVAAEMMEKFDVSSQHCD